mmetsp:Transcript_55211/g.119248  ORF Transcript_55211/g.119248 Transcript_55211/m.119248 type:complete len:307 (-) Transcript_55211:124-1044(-)
MALEFFDPHFHIWDLREGTESGHDAKVLLKPSEKALYDRADYEASLEALPTPLKHVGGVWVEGVSVCHSGLRGPEYSRHCLEEARWVSGRLTPGPYLLVPTCALEQDDLKEVLAQHAADPKLRGIRQILNCKPDWPRNGFTGDLFENAAWREGFKELRNAKLSFDLQLNPNQYDKAASFFAQFPEVPVIIDHLGTPTLEDLTSGAEQYWRGMGALAALPNTCIKISMLHYPDKNWDQNPVVIDAVHRVIGLFSVKRCFFHVQLPRGLARGMACESPPPGILSHCGALHRGGAQRIFQRKCQAGLPL